MSVFSLSPHCVWVVVYGGVREWLYDKSVRQQSSIADTAVVELGNDHIMNVVSVQCTAGGLVTCCVSV